MLLTQPAISLDSIPERRALGDAITPPARRCQVSDAVGEPLVSLAEWGVPTLDAYAELGILPPRDLKVRNHVCARLQSARSVLPEGFDVIVLDGYRTLAEQQALIDHYRAPSEFVASTSPDAMRPPHTTGAAVDLTLSWHGDPLAIGTDYDSFEPEAALEAFESGPDNVIRRLRRLLGITMMWAGFARYSPEWWHWSYGDDVWAAQKRCRTLYEVAELELSPQTS